MTTPHQPVPSETIAALTAGGLNLHAVFERDRLPERLHPDGPSVLHEDLGDRMGVLDSMRLRAARVVVDLGVHLGKDAGEYEGGKYGSGPWNHESAWKFLRDNVAMDPSFLSFELDRYLGWPGQAPSYKVGQRIWNELRDEAHARAGASGEEFDMKAWHMNALAVGSVGLDVLREALAK